MALASGQVGIYTGKENLILGLDPGRDKIGFAFSDFEGRLILSGIFPYSKRDNFFNDFTHYVIEGKININKDLMSHVKFVSIGNGTHSREFTEYVKNKISCEILTVDEKNTTLEARGLYWEISRPSFFMRLLPEGLRVPSRVLDDLAAWSIALRGLKKYRDISGNKL